MPKLIVKCAVACHDASGKPAIVFYRIPTTKAGYAKGEHYTAAEEEAYEDGYSLPMITFDEHDGPAWMFKNFYRKN